MTHDAFILCKNRIVCGKDTVHQDHLLITFLIAIQAHNALRSHQKTET